MPVEVKCPGCQALLRIADENIGRKSRCPSCSHVFTAEPSPAYESPFVAPLDSGAPSQTWSTPEPSSNPYAPTLTQPEFQVEPGEFGPRRITLDEVLFKSWTIFKTHWAMICVAALIVMAVNFACNMLQNGVVQVVTLALQDQGIAFAVQALMSIVFWVVQIWLQLGQVMVMLDVARGRPINLSKLFAGGPFLMDAIVATLILSLIMGGVAAVLVGIPVGVGLAVTQSGEGAAVGAGIGLVLAAIPLTMIALALFQYQFLIVDRRLKAVDSLRKSYEITRGNKLTLLLLGVVLAGISVAAMLVGLLALCVGVIPAIIAATGFSGLVFAVTYLSMTGQRIVLPGSAADPASASYGSPVQ